MADINALLARLNASSNATPTSSPMHHPQPQAVGYQPPYVSSPSVERASMLSPGAGTGSVRGGSSNSQDLLNLLKFNNQPGGNPASRAVSSNVPVSMADLLAGTRQSSMQPPSIPQAAASSSNDTQNMLLNLLKPASSSTPQPSIETVPAEETSAANSAASAHNDEAPASVTGPARGKSPFTYVNPFEQLAASVPETSEPASNKATAALAHQDSPAPSPMPDGRSKIEALLGIGSTDGTSTSKSSSKKDEKKAQKAAQEAAADIKADLTNAQSKADIEQGMSPEMIKGFESKIDEIAKGPVADSWEAAEAAESKADAESGVRVFNFPMRPFVAIDVDNLPVATPVRDDVIMKIASLKRDFDQIDRTLASATTNFIVYAMTKTGGIRVIRQEDGKNKKVFNGAMNQIFNISIGSAAAGASPTDSEPVLATGVNGSVYWTAIPNNQNFADEDLDMNGFIFPPLPQAEENTSGAQLKTHVKLSSKHPEFFAVGRGKSIHIVWPQLAMRSAYLDKQSRKVDTQRYLDDFGLKIGTGKAGKDFSFSADDTVIVSLDKAGRLKFWDIREHTDPVILEKGTSSRNVDLKTPVMVIPTTSPAEKSSATSVLFIDREKNVAKGQAMRYVLIGTKQNHTLQLWDLTLGKVVQEVNFPHASETDPICTISWYGKTNILAVGHPTRNSVFFVHLSLPRHNLPSISQAEYMGKLAQNDKSLPKAESTAIMSGIRELSLSTVGQLLSISLTETASSPDVPEVDRVLFDGYVMHTRGVTALSIRHQDLGWYTDRSVIDSHDAAKEKVVSLRDLRQPATDRSQPESSPAIQNTPLKKQQITMPTYSPQKPPSPIKAAAVPARVASPPISVPTAETVAPAQAKGVAPNAAPAPAPVEPVKSAQAAPATPASGTKELKASALAAAPAILRGGSTRPDGTVEQVLDASALADTMSKALSSTLSDILSKVLGDLFEGLYRRLDDEKRVAEAAGSAKQDAVLRLVSSTLTDNVEKSLNRIISGSIEKSVLPALSTTVSAAVERKVADAVAKQLQATLSKDLQSALTAPITAAMQDPKVVRSLNDQLTSKVTSHVEHVFTTTLSQTITPAFQKLATSSASNMTAAMEKRVSAQVQELNIQRQADTAKIDKLTTLTTSLVDSVRAMTGMLADSQKEIMALQAQLTEQLAARSIEAAPAAPADPEMAAIDDAWSSGRFEEATIKWLQSDRRTELFDLFFSEADPTYLAAVNPIVNISVAACVTEDLNTSLPARLAWLEASLSLLLENSDPDAAQHAPRVAESIITRLMEAYMALMELGTKNPMLSKISNMIKLARAVKTAAGGQ